VAFGRYPDLPLGQVMPFAISCQVLFSPFSTHAHAYKIIGSFNLTTEGKETK